MTFSLKKIIVPEYGTKFLFYFLAFVLWVMIYFSEKSLYEKDFNSTELFSLNYITVNILNLAFTGINAFFLYLFLKNFTIIRTKSFIPIFTFLIVITTWSNTHQTYYPHLTLTLIVLAIHNLFKSYKDKNESHRVFIGSLFISVSSLINPVLLFLFPFVIFGIHILKSLSVRTFIASTIGFITPWILYISYLIYFNPDSLERLFLTKSEPKFLFYGIDLVEIIYNGINLLLLIIGIIGLIQGLSKDSIQTRNYIYFILMIIGVSTLIILFFASSQAYLLPLLAFLSAIIVGHPISLSNNTIWYWYFLIFMLTNITYVCYNFIVQ